MKKAILLTLALLMTGMVFFGAGIYAGAKADAISTEAIPVKVLILPKFEFGEMKGDFPGEAQYYYERYLDEGKAIKSGVIRKTTRCTIKTGSHSFCRAWAK